MWFWWFMFVCDLLIPILMIISGRIMWKHPPQKINGILGYRTTRSMKNKDTWEFAHNYCGKLWWKTGFMLLIPSAIIHFPFYNRTETEIGIIGSILCTMQCVVMIVPIFLTEQAINRTFTDECIRK